MIQIDMEMPKCCDECFALDDHGDYPYCLISQDQRGYTFNVRENRMPSCPLKAQEPRVLELEDVNRLEQNEVVWLEDKGIVEIIPAIVVSHGHLYAQQSVCLMIVENPRLWIATFDYRERWRCWTSRPTDEQRRNEPWEQ